jgi:hypothetical protein
VIVGWVFTFAAAAYNLVRLRNLTMQATYANAKLCRLGWKGSTGTANATKTLPLVTKIAKPGQHFKSQRRFSAA